MYFWNSSHFLWNFARIGYKGFDHKYSFVGIRVIPLDEQYNFNDKNLRIYPWNLTCFFFSKHGYNLHHKKKNILVFESRIRFF